MVPHVFLKDLRHVRWPLLAWLGIVVGRFAVAAAMSEFAFAGGVLQIALENVAGLLTIVDTLMLLLLVSWLVHDDPLVGADAFSLTRPIPRTALMAEKLIFAAIFLVAAPALGEAAAVAVVTRMPSDSARVLPPLLFEQAGWVAVLLAVATLTPSLTRLLLTLAGCVIAIVIALSVNTTVLMTLADANSYHESALRDVTSSAVSAWVLIAGMLAAIAWQYGTRRTGRGWAIAIAAVAASVWVGDVWPWRFAAIAEPDPGEWARDTARVAAVVDRGADPYVSDVFAIRRGARAKKQIALPIRLTGMPLDYSNESTSIRARLQFPDGRSVESAQGIGVAVRSAAETDSHGYLTRLQSALGAIRLLAAPSDRAYSQWPVVLLVDSGEYERVAQMPGRLDATIHFLLTESREIAALPLVEGARSRTGPAQFEIRRVVKRRDSAAMLIRQSQTSASWQPASQRSYQFVLRNRSRGEALLGDSEPAGGHGLQIGGWSFTQETTSRLAFADVIAHYPSQATLLPAGASAEIDMGWLNGAELVVVETAYAGHVTRTFTLEGFQMRK